MSTELGPQLPLVPFNTKVPADNGAALAALSNAAAGRALILADGVTFTSWATPSLLATRTSFVGNPATKIESTVPGTGVATDAAIVITQPAPAVPNVGVLTADVVVDPPGRTLLVNLPTKPVLGHALLVQHGAKNTCQAQYIVEAISAGAAPWTVTVDRPVVWPFTAAGSIVTEYDSIPSDVTIDGRGMNLSGTGTQSIELAAVNRVKVSGVNYIRDDGNLVGSAIGIDVACQECACEDFTIDSPNGSAGLYVQSNERTVITRGKVRNAGSGYALFDSYQTSIVDSWSYNTTNAAAPVIQIDRIDVGGFGGIECWVTGGGAIGCASIGVAISNSKRGGVLCHEVESCPGGFYFTNSIDQRANDISARNITNDGIHVDGCDGIFIDGGETDRCAIGLHVLAGSTNTCISHLKSTKSTTSAIVSSADLRLEGYVGAAAAGDGLAFIQATAADFIFSGHLTCNLALSTMIQVSAGTFRIHDSTFDMVSGANSTAAYLTGGKGSLEACNFNLFAGAFGLVVAGADVVIDRACRFGTTGVPFTITSGSVTVEQSGDLAKSVAAGDVTLTFDEARNLLVHATGAPGVARNVVFPTVKGMAWLFINETVQTVTAKTAAGVGPALLAGHRAWVYCDGTDIVLATTAI